MISIKECCPNWRSALKKHVDFMQPRIDARIDFYLKLVNCIKHGRENTLDSNQFLTHLKSEFSLNDASSHRTFKAKANVLFTKGKKEKNVLSSKVDYFNLISHSRLYPSLANLDKVFNLLTEIKGEVKEILTVEFTPPYQNDYRVLKINSILFTETEFLFDEIFNYSDFSSLDVNEPWGPYQLLNELKMNVCPYCNLQYTYTISKGNQKIIRPDIDHFLPKGDSKNKYLQVSFFNLIPSCLACNQRLKNDEEICYTTHLNPYENNEKHRYIRFDYTPTLLSGANGNSDGIKIQIKCDSLLPSEKTKVAGNIKLFSLEEIYQMHKDIVQDLIKRKEVWDAKHISLTKNTYTDLRMTKQDAYRQLFGNYFDEKDFAKRPLSKLTKDIAEKLGLLK